MKKLISIIAAAAIAMSFTTAFAANADNMQEALVSVKERIDIPEEYSEFSSRENSSSDTSRYVFNWHTEGYDKSIEVYCHEDGIITSYNNYTGYYGRDAKMSSMSNEEAKAIAEEFADIINPSYPYEYVVEDSTGSSLYSSERHFPITIYINGVQLSGAIGSVTVNEETKSVTGYDIWYEPNVKINFSSAQDFISKEAAEQAHIEKIGLKLVYRSYYDDDDKRVFYPVYVRRGGYNEYINAVTGDVVEITSYSRLYADKGYSMDTIEESAASAGGLSPRELQEIENINGLISKADIEKQIRENKILALPAELTISNTSLYKNNYDDTYYYSISMSDSGYNGAYMTVNAKTGEIISYNRYISERGETSDYTRRNDNAFKELAGSKAAEYRFNEAASCYERYINGIPVQDDTAYISYVDGTLTNYHISYSDAQFPSIDGAMSAEEAGEAMFAVTDYHTYCAVSYDEDGKAEIYAVYDTWDASINPFTGKAVDYRNEEITSGESRELAYSDIDGHYAEKYITALADYNIGFEGGEFKPDDKITQADLLTLLTSVTGGGSVIIMYDNKEQADYAYSRAVRNNIITEDERDDNAVITRETASIYLIRAIGAEEYAKYNDIYVPPFDDVTENKGYIALLNAMGVVNGDDGHFTPKREITRAEFAVMLYNYLNR